MSAPPEVTGGVSWTTWLETVSIIVINIGAMGGVAWRLLVRFERLERKTNLLFGWMLQQFGKDGVPPHLIQEFFEADRRE